MPEEVILAVFPALEPQMCLNQFKSCLCWVSLTTYTELSKPVRVQLKLVQQQLH